jgi:hypothetical protein
MSVKVFSPNVQSVEIVQRSEKKRRRARLYYMRFVIGPPPSLFGYFSAWTFTNRSYSIGTASTTAAVSRTLWPAMSVRRRLSWAVAAVARVVDDGDRFRGRLA